MEKKDLTNLIDFSEKEAQEGNLPEAPAGSIFEETPIEKVEEFVSFDQYAQSQPMPEAPEDPFLNTPSTSSPETFSENFEKINSTLTENSSTETNSSLESSLSQSESSFTDPLTFNVQPPEENTESLLHQTDKVISSSSTVQKIKEFAENTNFAKSVVPAAFPFSLLIEGNLSKIHQEKLLDLISKENMGIREVDLEPQFAGHKILIPRISEYAGILLVQALREAKIKIKMGPSDLVFQSTQFEKDTSSQIDRYDQKIYQENFSEEINHPAETIPITFSPLSSQSSESSEIIIASAVLKTQSIETESTHEYIEMVDKLKKEIQYKAYRKGATKIIDFKVQLQSLPTLTLFRVLVMGTIFVKKNREKIN